MPDEAAATGHAPQQATSDNLGGALRELLSSVGVIGARGVPLGAPAQRDSAVACLELHANGSTVIDIQVLVDVTGRDYWVSANTQIREFNFLEGSLRGDIPTDPGTTWRVIGGLEPGRPEERRSRFWTQTVNIDGWQVDLPQNLYVYAVRGPLESHDSDVVGAPLGSAQEDAVIISGVQKEPGLYRGWWLYVPDAYHIADLPHQTTLFKGWQPCWT